MKALLAIALVVGSGLQGSKHDLLWKPKVGQKLVYAIKVDGTLMDKRFLFSGDVHLRVKKVEANGDYTVGTTFKNGVSEVMGNTEKIPEAAEETERYNARGDSLDPKTYQAEDDDAFAEIISRVADFERPVKPVAIGDSWTYDFPAEQRLGLPKAVGKYKFLEETDGKFRVSIEYRETSGADPTVAKGVAVLDVASGTPISVVSDVDNARVSDGIPPAKLQVTMKLK